MLNLRLQPVGPGEVIIIEVADDLAMRVLHSDIPHSPDSWPSAEMYMPLTASEVGHVFAARNDQNLFVRVLLLSRALNYVR